MPSTANETPAVPPQREELAERLRRNDPTLARPLTRLRRERWHLWQTLWRVYAGEEADPSLAEKWREDAEEGGLPGRLQHGYLEEALARLAEFEDDARRDTRADS